MWGFGAVVWKCVKVVESVSKQAFKHQLAAAIETSSIFTAGKMLPSFWLSVFDAIFTDNLWSLRGFARSCLASTVVVTILFGAWYSSIPGEWALRIYKTGDPDNRLLRTWIIVAIKQPTPPGFRDFIFGPHGELGFSEQFPFKGTIQAQTQRLYAIAVLPFFYNLFTDFVALLITRGIARYVADMSTVNILRIVVMFVFSSVLILVLSSVFMDLSAIAVDYLVQGQLTLFTSSGQSIFTPRNYLKAILFPLFKNHTELLGGWTIGTVYGVFIWSTLMGVVWLGIFSISVIVANFSSRLGGIGPWLARNFHVRSQPFRILAILAILATLLISGPCLIYHFLM